MKASENGKTEPTNNSENGKTEPNNVENNETSRPENVKVKRIYETPEATDGARVLVDRLWPRGISKQKAGLTEWAKEVAPSTELRKWYDHDPAKYDEFKEKYQQELSSGPQAQGLEQLRELAAKGPLTLLTASKAVDISEAAVLAQLLNA